MPARVRSVTLSRNGRDGEEGDGFPRRGGPAIRTVLSCALPPPAEAAVPRASCSAAGVVPGNFSNAEGPATAPCRRPLGWAAASSKPLTAAHTAPQGAAGAGPLSRFNMGHQLILGPLPRPGLDPFGRPGPAQPTRLLARPGSGTGPLTQTASEFPARNLKSLSESVVAAWYGRQDPARLAT